MSKTKILTFGIIALFVINISTLSFLFLKPPRENNRERRTPKEIVIKKLNFKASQIESYELLINKHRLSIEKVDNKIRETKNILYKQLALPENKKATDSILNVLSTYKSEIEVLHYNHFLDIKTLCKPEQLNDFNALTLELAKLFMPIPKPKHHQ